MENQLSEKLYNVAIWLDNQNIDIINEISSGQMESSSLIDAIELYDYCERNNIENLQSLYEQNNNSDDLVKWVRMEENLKLNIKLFNGYVSNLYNTPEINIDESLADVSKHFSDKNLVIVYVTPKSLNKFCNICYKIKQDEENEKI